MCLLCLLLKQTLVDNNVVLFLIPYTYIIIACLHSIYGKNKIIKAHPLKRIEIDNICLENGRKKVSVVCGHFYIRINPPENHIWC